MKPGKPTAPPAASCPSPLATSWRSPGLSDKGILGEGRGRLRPGIARTREAHVSMPRLEAGELIDGFRLQELVHEGSAATIWRVSHPDAVMPMIMKVPLLRAGDHPVAIVGYEVEARILPRLTGIHVPRFVAAGGFERPYLVMEWVAGRSLE